ncbi:hypothetical protein [Winogradskyella algicola]|uniref:hypothetical protein n=1 Tax=Winogradskyella algicola TaxID=2575815 RepID=UPI001107DF70|nr:hypothetical protein [Winogradskyella algicola]
MKRFKSLIVLMLFTLIFACNSNTGKFLITNKSNFDVDSLSILPDSEKALIRIKQGESLRHNINMNEVKTDGSYLISFKNETTNQTITRAFGYYTNGYQTEHIINIKIMNDTILINSEFKHLY